MIDDESMNNTNKSISIQKFKELIECERGLLKAIEHSTPILKNSLKIPQASTADDDSTRNTIQQILAYARMLSSRTSAPPSWDPTMQLINFATPNPLPHQLRGGALAAMQLAGAKLDKVNKNKKRLEEEKEKEEQNTKQQEKRKHGEVKRVQKGQQRKERKIVSSSQQVVTMNLSDSSSSEEEESDDDDESDN